ncbi:MAG: SMP-30/gluconolactonase/LRE family protein [Crocinitomicaceae bacterium]|nr:SMP-30/gluconolactonase/LRE family protein [Flavobacteriales bacterium]NQZ38306.1 SMP-30/gluconolactonase/LRE family protein [Crocinitomicaceae bacterium]
MKKGTLIFMASALYGLTLSSCALTPLAYQPEVSPSFEGPTHLNEKLLASKKIQIDGWLGPEDILFDSLGNLYTGVHNADFSDGRILKIDPSGKVEEFYNSGSWVAGLHFDKEGNLIALSHKQGLISISPTKQVTVLAATDENGKPFLIPNGLDIANDGMIYFSNTSEISAYTIKYGRKIIMEMKAIGGLYSYNPTTKKVTTLIAGTYFGNGVVISKDQDYLLMVETTKYRVLKYWLSGEKMGQSEVFIDNLPGFPNGISIRENGSYWLGYSTKRSEALDKIHPKPGMKKFVYGLPEFAQPKAEPFGMIMNISSDGEILETLFDTQGEIFSEAGAVKEFNGYLYIGGDVLPYIGKYKLD